MTKLEEAARAACIAGGFDPDEECYGGKRGWELWINETRAVIEALREPSEAIVVEGFLASQCKYADLSNDQLRAAWQVMLDAILSEEPQP